MRKPSLFNLYSEALLAKKKQLDSDKSLFQVIWTIAVSSSEC